MKFQELTRYLAVAAAVLLFATPALAADRSPKAENMEQEALDAVDDSTDASIETEVEAEEEKKAWSVGANTGISFGVGTFVTDEFVRRERIRWNFGVNGSYRIPVIDVNVSARTGFSQWVSRGGGGQEPQEFRWADSSLSFSRSIYTIPVIDLGISGSLGFAIPTSTFSRAADLYTSIRPGLSFGGSVGPVGYGYSISGGINFHEFTTITFDPSEVDILSRDAGNEVVANDAVASPGGVLTQYSLSNNFNVSYRFPLNITLAVGFGFSDFWSYDNGSISEEDEFVADNADVGRSHGQFTNGSISLSYRPIPYLGMSLSLSSSQPWKTADNQGYRFPFFDFENAANNFTYVGFGLSGNY